MKNVQKFKRRKPCLSLLGAAALTSILVLSSNFRTDFSGLGVGKTPGLRRDATIAQSAVSFRPTQPAQLLSDANEHPHRNETAGSRTDKSSVADRTPAKDRVVSQMHINTTLTPPSLTKDTRPLALLHIGPHKTASSAIQCEFTHSKELLHAEASFEYLGRIYTHCLNKKRPGPKSYVIDTRALVGCMDKHDAKTRPCNERPEWIKFEALLKKLAQANRNIILSDEAFSRMKATEENLSLLSSTLTQSGFRVRVAIVYRRYFEWLLSMYNERYKPLMRRNKYQKWPGAGGNALRTFPDYYRRSLDGKEIGSYQLAAQKRNLHPAQYLRELWEPHFPDTVIINMHETHNGDDSTVTNFVHKVFGREHTTHDKIASLLKRAKGPKNANPSINLDYDLLAVAAYKHGLVRKSLKRRVVARVVEKAFGKLSSVTTVPRVCLSPVEEQGLLNRSLSLEHELFPTMNNLDEGSHETQFEKASKRHRFCNVDAEQLLATSTWKKFFQSL